MNSLPGKTFRSGCSFIFRRHVVLSTNSYSINEKVPIDRTLLITHGMMGSKQNWNSLAKNLKHQFKEVVTIDLRNHGDSPHVEEMSLSVMSDDIEKLIISNHYNMPILVGHSLGGKVAMRLALTKPDLLSGLVVVDISPIGNQRITQFRNYVDSMINAPIDQSASLSTNRKTIDLFMQNDIESSDVRNFLLTNLFKDSSTNEIRWRVNLHAVSQHMSEFFEFSVCPGWQFKGPVLFVGGTKSDYIKEDHWPLIQKLFPSATLKMIEGAGHWVHADRPHQFVELLLKFGMDLQSMNVKK